MTVSGLSKRGKFNLVSYDTPLDGFGAMSVQGYVAFESRMSVFDQIMHDLTGFEIGMIGVWGPGGVGKTTLVNKVAEKAKQEKLFNEVVMATVTNSPDTNKIQNEIAEMLGLKFDGKTEKTRANELRKRLKDGNKVLVILDDLWRGLDLGAVGIPFKDQHKGCTILLTSRNRGVLSTEVDCQKNFFVDVLPEEECRDLFKKMVGDKFESLEFEPTAVEIVKECGSLPVALVTVARTLRNKSLDHWKTALRDLRMPSSRNPKGMQAIKYHPIELSYDRLESKELKAIFILCSLMDNNSSVHELLKYGIGLGLFGTPVTVEEAQNNLRSRIHDLKESCLLLNGDSMEQFAIHDIVRDIAISIASTDHHVFIRSNGEEIKEQIDKNCKMIWLKCNITMLLEELECQCLDFFYTRNNDPNSKLPKNIFKGMHKLKVLALVNFSFSSLPSPFSLMANLQTLCLDEYTLGDIVVIGELKTLEVLSFVKSNIKHLPMEIGQLTKLRLLDLSDCSQLEVIPPNVISRLSLLEELYMRNSFDRWEIERDNNHGQKNASLVELKDLPNLTSLEVHIRDVRALLQDLYLEKLQRYKILVGDDWVWNSEYKTQRTLMLNIRSDIHLEHQIQILMKRTEDLYLHELKGVKNVLYELDREGFPQLKHIEVRSSPDVQYIINTMGSSAFPMLESLGIIDLISLEKICHGKLGAQPFEKLTTIEVSNCEKLKNLFSFSIFRGLSQLEKIDVSFCLNMEYIVAVESEAHVNKMEAVDQIKLTQLRSLRLSNLLVLKSMCSKVETSNLPRMKSKLLETDESKVEVGFTQSYSAALTSSSELSHCCFNVKMPRLSRWRSKTPATELGTRGAGLEDGQRAAAIPRFNEKIVFPNLEELQLYSIKVESLWDGQLPTIASCVQNLTTLEVSGCSNLKYVFSCSMVKSLKQLKYLSVWDCEVIEEIIVVEGLGAEEANVSGDMLFPKLGVIELYGLPNLNWFCIGNKIECPLLKRLAITRCPKLKTLVSDSIIAKKNEVNTGENINTTVLLPLFDNKVAFPSLTELTIYEMENLEKIWHSQLVTGSFCTLRSVDIKGCQNLVNIFSHSMLSRAQRLEEVSIRNCYSLQEVFEVEVQGLHVEMIDFQLRKLYLRYLPALKHIWNKDLQHILSFRNLQSIMVSNCHALKNLFPFSIATDLPQLEELEIWNCGVEEIVAKEENANVGVRTSLLMFPKLTFLKLMRLSNFTRFDAGSHITKWPMLKKLEVGKHEVKHIFTSKSLDFQEISENSKRDNQFEKIDKVMPNLEKLSVKEYNNGDTTTSILWLGKFLPKLFATLKILELESFIESNAIPFGLVQRFCNLETLNVRNSAFEVLFSYERLIAPEKEQTWLRNLEIYFLDDLRHIWEEDCRLFPLLQNLHTLNVSYCDSLVNLAPPSASFLNLTTLKLDNCDGLLSLMTSSTAKSLVQLKELRVESCRMMMEIVVEKQEIVVEKQGDETKNENEIIFNKLESLILVDLLNLKSFCSENYTFKFPSLGKVIVTKCPSMRIFSQGHLSAPKLRKVQLDEHGKNEVWLEENLNVTIQHLYTKMEDPIHPSDIYNAESDDVPLEESTLPERGLESNTSAHQTPFEGAEEDLHEDVVNILASDNYKTEESLDGAFTTVGETALTHNPQIPAPLGNSLPSKSRSAVSTESFSCMDLTIRSLAAEPSIVTGPETSCSSPTITSEYLQQEGKALTDNFNMSFDNLEKTALSLIQYFCNSDERKNLEYLLSQLKEFKSSSSATFLMNKTQDHRTSHSGKRASSEKNEAGVQSKLPSSSKQPTLDFQTVEAGKKRVLDESKVLNSENLHATDSSYGSKDQLSEVETTIEPIIEEQITGPEITQMGVTYLESHATSYVKEPTPLALAPEPNTGALQPPLDGPELKLHQVSISENVKKEPTIGNETTTEIFSVPGASSTHIPQVQVEERAQPSPSNDAKVMGTLSSSPVILTNVEVPPTMPTCMGNLTLGMPAKTMPPECSSSTYFVSRNLFAQLSSMTETRTRLQKTNTSGPSFAPTYDYLQQQREKLREYFNMSLEAIQEANAFDDVERITRSLIQHSSSLFERKNLENFLSRLTGFRENVSCAMCLITTANSKKFMKLEANLSQRQGQLNALESKLSKVLAEKLNLEIEIKRLISKKEALLDLLKKTKESVSKDLAELQNWEEAAKQAEDNFCKGKEMLNQANASWTFFKQWMGME